MSTFQELISGELPVLVDFFATWCGPCHALAPTLEQLAAEEKGRLKIIKVDVDKNPQAAAAFRVSGVPTLMLFRKGEALWRQSGVVPLHHLKSALSPYLN
jgi:thioredoxin 1